MGSLRCLPENWRNATNVGYALDRLRRKGDRLESQRGQKLSKAKVTVHGEQAMCDVVDQISLCLARLDSRGGVRKQLSPTDIISIPISFPSVYIPIISAVKQERQQLFYFVPQVQCIHGSSSPALEQIRPFLTISRLRCRSSTCSSQYSTAALLQANEILSMQLIWRTWVLIDLQEALISGILGPDGLFKLQIVRRITVLPESAAHLGDYGTGESLHRAVDAIFSGGPSSYNWNHILKSRPSREFGIA